MLTALLILLVPSAWGPSGCATVVAPRLSRNGAFPPILIPQPAVRHVAPGVLCSDQCSCGCNDGQACRCGNARAPVGQAPEKALELPTGVDHAKISPKARYTIGGKEAPREDAVYHVQRLADDSAKQRLTLIGGEPSVRKAVRDGLMQEEWLKPLVLVKDYDAGHWAVAKHKCEGLTMYLQEPNGTVLVREVNIGAGRLSSLVQKLKDAILKKPLTPTPGPDGKTPDGKDDGKGPPAPKKPSSFHPATWAAAAGLLLLFLTLRRLEPSDGKH